MKILIINTYPDGGGAAIAARRLAEALVVTGNDLKEKVTTSPKTEGQCSSSANQNSIPTGIASSERPSMAMPRGKVALLTLYPFSPDAQPSGVECAALADTPCRKRQAQLFHWAERGELFLRNGLHRDHLFDLSPSNWGFAHRLIDHPWIEWADIIHLHWINHGLLSLQGLEQLGQKGKPVVCTLHDQWLCTHAAHHTPDPNVYQSPWEGHENHWIERLRQQKEQVLNQLRPTIVGCSEWITKVAASSLLTQSFRRETIPNAIDTDFFSPRETVETSSSHQTKHLLLGAVRTSDPRKGFAQWIAAARKLQERDFFQKNSVVWDLFGHISPDAREQLTGLPIIYHGYIESPTKMVELYRQAHALVVPSLFENLPNTIMESLACGTPVIAFRTGGIPEMIEDGTTGALCRYADAKALAKGIERLITCPPAVYTQMRSQARLFALEHYSQSIVAARHRALYTDLLN